MAEKPLPAQSLTMTMALDGVGRISVTREGDVFRLMFRYDAELVARVKSLPYAAFDPETKTWTSTVCEQSLDILRQWRWDGLLSDDPDRLIGDGEKLEKIAGAVLRGGTVRRPFLVHTAMRDDDMYQKLVAIPGARWEKAAGAVSYPAHAAPALAELVDKGVVSDPLKLLQPAAVVVAYDSRFGEFRVRGDDRAAEAFKTNFPTRDVMQVWRERGLDVAFADTFSEEMYLGEIARRGGGVQPEGMAVELYDYQKTDLAVALSRSGVGIFSSMGVGKCLDGESVVVANGEAVTMEDLWAKVRESSLVLDDEGGEWGELRTETRVPGLGEDGEYINGRVSRAYRQKIDEDMKLTTVEDGREVWSTLRHKFLTRHQGWSNDVEPGDFILVEEKDTSSFTWKQVTNTRKEHFTGWVYDLEIEGHHNFVANGILCHNTILGIAAGHELMTNRGEVPRTIVVVPPSIRTQWRNEIMRFTGCGPEDVAVVDGDKKQRMTAYDKMENGARWLIVHYQAIILAEDTKRLEKLAPGSFIVFDECHRLKNQQAKTTKVAQNLAKKAARRMGLSGTPVENNPGEWYNVLSGLLIPGVFGTPIDFLNRYCYPGKFGGYEGAKNIAELRKRSKPLYVRHTFNEVAAHLPPLRVQTIHLDPRPEYAAALKRAHREARDEIRDKRVKQLEKKGGVLDGYDRDEVEGGAEMTAVGMLKLLCSSPLIVARSESPAAEALRDGGLVPDEDGPKLDELRVMCAEMQSNNERVVVFSGSKRMANLIAERLEEDGVRHVLFTGDTSSADRDAAVRAFTTPGTESDPGPTVFVATDAGAEGLNLGTCCSTLVNVDIPWTPGRLGQRNARVRRIDSTATSFLIVNLVVRGTIEEGILRMIEHKADLQDAILGETGGRRTTTGRGGRNIFEEAMQEWERDHDGK